MSYKNDKEAFCLANTYGLHPPVRISPSRIKRTDTGKFEPDHNVGAETRTMVLAHWLDKTNLLIQYKPAELEYE